jgi:VWFA-related protein
MPFVRPLVSAPRSFLALASVVLTLTLGGVGQASSGQTGNAPAGTSATPPPSSAPDGPTSPSPVSTNPPTSTLKISTRLVSLEVVARDRQGHPVRGLTAKDFQVSEEVVPKKDHRPQNISVFQAEDWADLQAAQKDVAPLPPGVYSNLVNRQKEPVPPTVLLFDGINTDVESQMQVHHQIVKILGSIPPDVPVAAFLMGDRLRLLQTFTTDPKLLREAAAKTMVVGQAAPDQDPTDNPDSLAAALDGVANLPPGLQASLSNFDQAVFTLQVQVRMHATLDALRSIARYLSGYPGRKNILWISTSFPLLLLPGEESATGNSNDLRAFQGDMQEVGSALMDAKIAIYPMDPGGVRTQSMFSAEARVRQPSSGQRMGQAIQREDSLRQGAQQVMSDLADQTGGRVCVNDNDLGDCVKKAVDDASSYYELGYYPDAGDFRGEFHRITVKTTVPGVHLSYREGYYAKPMENASEEKATAGQPDSDPRLRRAACEDPLTSTAVLLMAKPIPPDEAGAAKYFLAIDSHMLSFVPQPAGGRELGLSVAACTFDKTGQPLQYLQKNSLAKLNDEQFTVASHGITQTFQFSPKPGVARVRLLVRDFASGRIGSVDIPYTETPKPAPTLMSEPPPPAKP